MARNQPKRNVGEPARSALSSLGELLQSAGLAKKLPRQPSEFTIHEAAVELGISECTARHKLAELVKKGLLTRREGVEGTKARLFFRKA